MRKHVEPEVFEYMDCKTTFQTEDKELAIMVFEYAKGKAATDFDNIKKEVIGDLDADIKRLKKEIKEENDK